MQKTFPMQVRPPGQIPVSNTISTRSCVGGGNAETKPEVLPSDEDVVEERDVSDAVERRVLGVVHQQGAPRPALT